MGSQDRQAREDAMTGQEYPVETVSRCLICDDDRQKLLFRGQDDRYGYPGSFPVVECLGCGLPYLATRPQASAISALYQKYYASGLKEGGGPKPSAGWKESLKNSWLRTLYHYLIKTVDLYRTFTIAPGQRVLDVGSGLRVSDAQRLIKAGGEWLAVEVDQSICKALEAAGLQTFHGTLKEYQETAPRPFDYIVLSQVLEHIYQPRRFLEVARSLLRPGGLIVLSCPNSDSSLRQQYGERWLNWHIPYHVAHYNHRTLTLLGERTGLRVSRFQTITPANWYYAQTQIGQGLRFDERWLSQIPWPQRWLDLFRLGPRYRLAQGDALVAQLIIN